MSRTSQTFRRLGVAGVAVVTIGAGIPALLATSAFAAPATQLTLNPNPGKAAAGTCQVFTVDATDSTGAPATYDAATPSVSVQVSENPNGTTQTVSFCGPTAPFANTTGGTNTTEQNGSQTTSETAQAEFNLTRTPAAGSTVTSSTPTRATFGIRSNTPGGANIRAFIDNNNNDNFDAGEIQVLGTSSFTAGGTNADQNSVGGNAAQDAATTLTPGDTNSPVIQGQAATATVNVKNTSGDNVSGVIVSFRVTAGPNGPQTSANGTVTAGQSGQAVSNNAGNAVIQYTTNSTRTGTDTVQFFVNQTTGTTGGPDAGEPTATTSINVAPSPTTNEALARNIDLTPDTANTVAGNNQVFVARVITASGQPVQGITVRFVEEGPGRFSNGQTFVDVQTNNAGEARATTTSVAGESGTQVITASISSTGNRTNEAAGTPTGTTRAGNSSDTSTQTFSAASPSPSPSASAASPSPSATSTVSPSPSSGTQAPRLGISVSPSTITPGVQSVVTVTGRPSTVIELQAYSRPNTTYGVVRRGTIGESGTIEFRVLPGTNTRLFAAVTGQTGNESPSVVINVRTALSLTVVRNGSGDYTFQGRILPRRAGQLITLYRVESDGREIITSQIRTDNTGTYRIRRIFVGQGTFGFLTRTGQTLTNASGVSNNGQARPTAIYFGPQR